MKNIEFFIYSFICIQVVFVAIYDIKHKKISNQWSLLNLALFVSFLFIFPEMYQFKAETFLFSIVFIVVGFFGYLIRVVGAGDSKYLFSLFLLTPQIWHEKTFTLLFISTAIIGGFSIFTQVIQNYEKIVAYAKSGYMSGIRTCLGNKFPFAPVILMSWLWLGFYVF